MAVVALVPHRARAAATELAAHAIDWLESRGHKVRVPDADALAPGLVARSWPESELAAGLDLAVSLGGDGTMLRTVDLLGATGVPVLGVNVGHLGYLTEVEPDAMVSALERFFAADFRIQPRMTLLVESTGRSPATRHALNEAVLEKTGSGHTVRVGVVLNDEEFLTCSADGVIVATPTGSTAYNLSARGPIVSPAHRALVVTFVSPHMLFDRSLVLGPDETVRLEVLESRPASLTVDGADLGRLVPGDSVMCRAGTHDAAFVTFGRRDFHQVLKAKFRLADA
ncbi:MAG TPA: NAD(+)/NADH kinase [Acidimicrobiales bacterium]|nr:NAD(+)/NADH kinase [Acidimicrobiales bacterium]